MKHKELIDILDDNGNVIGTAERAEVEAENHTTQNVIIFLFNSEGKVWVQLRPNTKNHFPGKWDPTTCGGLLSGESADEAAKREVKEETSLDVELIKAEVYLNVHPGDNGEVRKRISHEYIGLTDEEPVADGEEVDEFKLWDPEELKQDIKDNPENYVPPLLTELEIALKTYDKTTEYRQ